jgi:hypothetical protein
VSWTTLTLTTSIYHGHGDLDTVSNPWNLKYDKAGSGYDRRHIRDRQLRLQAAHLQQKHRLAAFGSWADGKLPAHSSMRRVNRWRLDLVARPTAIAFGRRLHQPLQHCEQDPLHTRRVGDWFDTVADGGTSADPQAPPFPGYCGTVNGVAGCGQNLGFGDGRRDSFVGPGRVNFTTSLYKSFAVTERTHFEFRAESYNTFNHTEFNAVNATYSATGNYGQVTSDWSPRVLHAGARGEWMS